MSIKKPEFFIIGAQKAGTTWLWSMLEQHPGTSLPEEKEIHYFGSSELFARGDDWYYRHFRNLDADKVVGEASTSYFYDNVPFWYNKSKQLEIDSSLPTIPELMEKKYPKARYIVILRDPVRRAVSAYFHWMKQGELSPFMGLKKTAIEHPRLRILEYGFYGRYLELWKKFIPSDRLRILIFEEQIKKNWNATLKEIYAYLGLDPEFKPELPSRSVHRSWGWTRIVFNYYASKLFQDVGHSGIARYIDNYDFLRNGALDQKDIEFLRSAYLPERRLIEELTGKVPSSWDYGDNLLKSS